MFSSLVFGAAFAGLVITALFLFKRRRWQRIVVLTFGSVLLVAGVWLGAQPGKPLDIEFLGYLLLGTGLVLILSGWLLPVRAK